MSNPWDKFFWNDWENDPALKLCSFAAQGLWMRMLCICAKSEPKGYLIVNGNALVANEMSWLFGKPTDEIKALIEELEKKGVFSRDKAGKIYSRKMVKTEKKAKVSRENGKQNQRIEKESEENSGRIIRESKENLTRKNIESTENQNNLSNSKLNENNSWDTQNNKKPPTQNTGSIPDTISHIPEKKEISSDEDKSVAAATDLFPSPRIDYENLVSIWNQTAGQLCPKIAQITDNRRKKLGCRMRDTFHHDTEQWRAYCQRIHDTPFLTGDNDRQWRADFDWSLKPHSIAKVLEGAYERSAKTIRTTKTDAALEEARKKYANPS